MSEVHNQYAMGHARWFIWVAGIRTHRHNSTTFAGVVDLIRPSGLNGGLFRLDLFGNYERQLSLRSFAPRPW